MNDEKPGRLYFWDNAKGILIFLVVFGHFLQPYRSQPGIRIVFDLIYLFHMPAFVFISGYLSQKVSDVRKSILKLSIAYLLFNMPMMVYGMFCEGLTPSLLTPYYSYWYLIALIAWRLVAPTLSKSSEAMPISIAISILIGFWGEIGNQMALSRIIGFFPFFLAGYTASEDKLREFFTQKRPIHACLGFGLFALTMFLATHLSLTGIEMNDLVFFPYLAHDRFIYRICMLLISLSVCVSALLMVPQNPVWLLTKWGRNSLTIYVSHRYVTLLAFALMPFKSDFTLVLQASLLGSLVTIFASGLDMLNRKLNMLLDACAEAFSNAGSRAKAIRIALFAFFLCHLIFVISLKPATKSDIIHPVLTSNQKAQIENAVSIAFVGDLILLRDQVRAAYCPQKSGYDFNPLFEYAKEHLLTADFAIGVFEGPLAGSAKGYSTSNYDDGIPLRLNFPDSFVDAIKVAGIDLVTLANNHILDMEMEGAMRTLDVLDMKGIQHVGSYRNLDEKNRIKIIEIKGLRIAVLAYSYPSNYYSEDYFFEANASLTSVIVEKSSPFFNNALSQVQKDFERARAERPDIIVVLPHMGTQFIHTTDNFQKTWNEIFIREGADIILGDHSHAVQPVEFMKVTENGKERQTVIVNCPGNFVNSYVEHNGDATSMVKIYIDPAAKSVLCAGVVPMMTQAVYNGQHRALPVYDILFNPLLRNQISLLDMKRIREIQSLVTQVMLGTEISLDQAQKIYYLFPEGYHRQSVAGINLNDESLQNSLLRMLETSKTALFVGDSVTHGTKNGGYGWYEPLTGSFPRLNVLRAAWGGATTFTLLDKLDEIISHDVDLYVIAIGTNDIRYRDKSICAMSPQQYVENLEKLVRAVLLKRPEAKFVFVAPWPCLANDPFIRIPLEQRESMFSDYSQALESYCRQKGYLYVDPAATILSAIDQKIAGYYLLDHIHPNVAEGLNLYSEAFLSSAKTN